MDCLEELLAWSDAHPDHTPIFVFLEVKTQGIEDEIGPRAAAGINQQLKASRAPGPGRYALLLTYNMAETALLITLA